METRTGQRAQRAERVVVSLAALSLVASLFFSVHPWFDGRADAALYVATARSLAAGDGYTYLGVPFTLRPPGLSLLLAPLIAWRGVDFHAMHLLVSAFGALGIGAFFVWLRPRVGWPLALLAAACVWLNPGYQAHCNMVMSDVPAAALVLVCFVVDRWATRAPSWRRDALLGLLVGVACWFRSSAVLLLPAIVLARLFEAGVPARTAWPGALRRAGTTVLVGSGIAATWMAYAAIASPSTAAEQTRLHSYATVMLHEDSGDPESRRLEPGEILSRAPRRLPRIASVLGQRLASRSEPDGGVLRDALRWSVAAALVGALLLRLVRRREPPEIFACLSLLLLLLYVGLAARLLLPAYLVAFAALVELLRDLGRRRLGASAATAAVALVVVGITLIDLSPRHRWEQLEAEHRRRVEYFASLAAHLPEGARLATFKAYEYNVFLDQPTYGLRHALQRDGVEAAFERIVEGQAVDIVVLPVRVGPLVDQLEGLLTRRVGAPERVGAAKIWRLQPRGEGEG